LEQSFQKAGFCTAAKVIFNQRHFLAEVALMDFDLKRSDSSDNWVCC